MTANTGHKTEMLVTTEQKARLFDLLTTVFGLVRDRKRNAEWVIRVLQEIKDRPNFDEYLLPSSRQSDDLKIRLGMRVWKTFYREICGFDQFVELGLISVSDLGFKTETKCSEICKRLSQVFGDTGFCSVEIVNQLRSVYKDQPKREYLQTAQEIDSKKILVVGTGGAGEQFVDQVSTEVMLNPETRFVVRL